MSPNNTDRLSILPEEITSHILSLMPTKFAVRTSVLSRKWRYSWTTVTNLVFEDVQLHRWTSTEIDDEPVDSSDNFPRLVDRVLELCRSPKIHLFRLHLLHSYASNSSLINWIDRVVRLNVHELDIRAPIYDLPSNLLTCKTLTNLRLHRVSLRKPLCQSVNLPCMKILDIFVSTSSSVNAFKLINGCPVLESLSLEVERHGSKEDYIFNLPTLKRLKLTEGGATMINKVVLQVPNLEYLFVGGTLCSHFVMEHVPTFIEATLSISVLKWDYLWFELLKGLNGVKSLSTQNSKFKYLEGSYTCPLPIFPNMNRLELNRFCHFRLVSQFLESSPELQHLRVERKYSRGLYRGLSSWIEPELVPACLQTTLTTIKLCDGEKSDLKFLEYMLGNAQVLKRLTITWRGYLCMEKQRRLAPYVLNFAKASAHCKIHFLSNRSASTGI